MVISNGMKNALDFLIRSSRFIVRRADDDVDYEYVIEDKESNLDACVYRDGSVSYVMPVPEKPASGHLCIDTDALQRMIEFIEAIRTIKW